MSCEWTGVGHHSCRYDRVPGNQTGIVFEPLDVLRPSLLFIRQTLCELLSTGQLDLAGLDLLGELLFEFDLLFEGLLEGSDFLVDSIEGIHLLLQKGTLLSQ